MDIRRQIVADKRLKLQYITVLRAFLHYYHVYVSNDPTLCPGWSAPNFGANNIFICAKSIRQPMHPHASQLI
jgi:oligoribonuclease (3'-5' exoribonuclease)